MSTDIKEKLQIILITYNRATRLQETFDQILSEESPINDFHITVFDNDSTDDTAQVVARAMESHANLKYQKNNINVGGNANICKALESATRDYLWVLCDDDAFDWQGWDEVVSAINQNEDLIFVSNGFLSCDEKRFNSKQHLLLQASFLPTIIYSRRLLTPAAIRNAYDNLFALFPHITPIVMHFNRGGHAYVIKRGVVAAGGKPGDASYTRGYVPSEIFNRSRSMTMAVGMANILANLKDRSLAKKCYGLLTRSEWMGGRAVFYGSYFYNLRGACNKMNRVDIWMQSDLRRRFVLMLVRIAQILFGWAASPTVYGKIRAVVDSFNRKKSTQRRDATLA